MLSKGLSTGGGLSVNLNAQLSAITGYDNTIDMAMTRISVAQDALGQISSIGSTLRGALAEGNASAGNVNIAQFAAQSSLQQLVGLLNTRAGNRYLFSGLDTDQASMESYDHIINGDGARAGLKQLIDERTQADYGASGSAAWSSANRPRPPLASTRMRSRPSASSSARSVRP